MKDERSLREKASRAFRERFLQDEENYRKKLGELSVSVPGFAELSAELEATGLKALRAAIGGGDISGVRKETEELRRRRSSLLVAHGYAPDEADRRYRCEKCSDSGFVGLNMCQCLRRELTVAALEASGLGKLIRTQSFETFSLEHYSGREKALMKAIGARLFSFAKNFSEKTSDSFLLIGGTGLGKTHLATSVARVVVEKGYDVLYRPAQELFAVFNRQRFGDGFEGDGAERVFFDCDLLIIDDLGTEVTTQYTVSWLYDVVNSRMNAEKPTIISTNLTEDALRSRYDDRITSRLLFNYTTLFFVGRDIRDQKAQDSIPKG